jgi:hypothetical protein
MNSKSATTAPMKIESTPSGAQVYLDDVPIGVTPLISHVQTERPFKLRLIREGYMPNELIGEIATSSGYSRNIVLLQEPSAGYINIESDVRPGQNVVVIVNGQTVSRVLPFQAKVPAGTPVNVVVVNPYAKLQGSETVIVAQGQTKKLSVHVNKPAKITE